MTVASPNRSCSGPLWVSTCWMRASGTSVRLIQTIPRCRSTSSSRISYRHRRHLRSGTTPASTTNSTSAARNGRAPSGRGTSITRSKLQLTDAPTTSSGSAPRAPVMPHRVFARGSSLSAGSAFKGSGRERVGGTSPEVLRGELAAGGVYVLAPARPQRRREAEVPRVPEELPRSAPGGRGEAGVRPVEAEEVQVVERVIQETAESLHVPGLVVDPCEQGVLEEELAVGLFYVVAGGVHELRDRVPGGDGHEIPALVVEGGVERDREVELLRLVGEALDPVHQPARRDRDVPRGQSEPVRIV